jgi:predicted DNA-binding transcriptional regulator YafY
MKTDIFIQAIRKRNNLQFLYGLQEINIEPYYITKNRSGKKVIYGRLRNKNEIRKFEYDKIANIRIIDSVRFSPRIPINSFVV